MRINNKNKMLEQLNFFNNNKLMEKYSSARTVTSSGSFNCSEGSIAWKDPSDHKTVVTMYILAAINVLVIVQGCYTFNLRLKNDTKRMRNKTITFYFMALSCLVVAEFYFLSYKINTS